MPLQQVTVACALLALQGFGTPEAPSVPLELRDRSGGDLGAGDCSGAIIDYWSAQDTTAPVWLDCRGVRSSCISAAGRADGTELAVWWGWRPVPAVYVAQGGAWTLGGAFVAECLTPTGPGQRADLR